LSGHWTLTVPQRY